MMDLVVFMVLAISEFIDVREKLEVLEREKNDLFEKYCNATAELERKKNEKCPNCDLLTKHVNNAKKEMSLLKKQEKAKLLKTIVKSLESLDDGNTNAHQLFTQLCGGLDDSGESPKCGVTLIQDQDDNDEDSLQDARVLVNDTILEIESEESNQDKVFSTSPIIVPETEAVKIFRQNPSGDSKHIKNTRQENLHVETKTFSVVLKENVVFSEDEIKILPQNKRLKTSPVLSSSRRQRTLESNSSDRIPLKLDLDGPIKPKISTMRSPSVLSEIPEIAENSSFNSRTDASVWRMKPSVIVDPSTSAVGCKKLKQMTLSLAKPEKKHDISLYMEFNGGVPDVRESEEEKDLVMPSPQSVRKKCHKKVKVCETIEDPDLTLFNPAITSTCLPTVENSFDRLPEVKESPPYKYRRDTVRKKEDRRKLPGQDCDQCVKFYQAAGMKDSEVRARLNTCSRHRDKYQVRANTPPGFWDPVLPDSQE